MQVLAPDARVPNLRELIGIANDLEVETLLKASGLFPHSHFGRQKWLSPRERCVLFFGDFHMSMRLKRLMRQGPYAVSFDHDFEGVIKAAGPRRASCMPMPRSMTPNPGSGSSRTPRSFGFAVLNWHLARWGYRLNDGKWATPTIIDMGSHIVPRAEFLDLLAASVGQGGKPGRWTVEASPEVVGGWNWDDWNIKNGAATCP
jgi:leucyl/phenylalanyl-tRNA--protein transferase